MQRVLHVHAAVWLFASLKKAGLCRVATCTKQQHGAAWCTTGAVRWVLLLVHVSAISSNGKVFVQRSSSTAELIF
jgi:hypothetical protein